ncbi:MAG: dTDP-4-dehydrorhamnose reductase [Ignavibacteriae bacterium]|nr:MAG: dTDP-4-dehydrorhamnose reductase [Ignavibacteriota bacterium]
MYSQDIIKRRIFIVGANGMLGQRTIEFYKPNKNVQLFACSIEENPLFSDVDYLCCNITERDKIKEAVYNFMPDVIINAAAYTNVDLSETERETAWKINVKGVEHLAETARVIDAQVIHISSDYIFDGKKGPYSENDKPNPLGYYGRTKLASENVLKISGALYTILRTNVLYGVASKSKADFVEWLINTVRSGKPVRIVDDQFSNPTFIDDLVQAISKVIEFRKHGVYNIAGKEFLSRYEFTEIIADYFKLAKSLITPIKTKELNQAARRPLKSGLITLKAEAELGYKPVTIRESLAIIKKVLEL